MVGKRMKGYHHAVKENRVITGSKQSSEEDRNSTIHSKGICNGRAEKGKNDQGKEGERKKIRQTPLQSMDITVFVDMSAVWHISTH